MSKYVDNEAMESDGDYEDDMAGGNDQQMRSLMKSGEAVRYEDDEPSEDDLSSLDNEDLFDSRYRSRVDADLLGNLSGARLPAHKGLPAIDDGDDLDGGRARERRANDAVAFDADDSRFKALGLMQTPFHPGATAFNELAGDSDDSDAEQTSSWIRYLAWSSIGFVLQTIDEQGDSHVSLEFEDKGRYPSVRFHDRHGICFAALGVRGAVFGSPGSHGREENRNLWPSAEGSLNGESVVYYRVFEPFAFGSRCDWIIPMRQHEFVCGVAIGRTFVAASTSRRMIRLFSHTGVETNVLSWSSDIIAMVGSGKYLNVVSDATGLSAATQLTLQRFDLQADGKDVTAPTQQLISGVKVSISADSTLRWLGVTDVDQPCTLDSDGVVRVLHYTAAFGWAWVPVVDPWTAFHEKEPYLVPTAVSTDKVFGVAVPDTALEPPPGTHSTDNAHRTVPLRVPVLQNVTVRDKYLRLKLTNDELKRTATVYTDEIKNLDEQMDGCLKEQFEGAVASDHIARALDLATMMTRKATVEGAVHFAKDHRRSMLAERLEEVLRRHFRRGRDRVSALPTAEEAKKQHIKSLAMSLRLQKLEKRQRDATAAVLSGHGVGGSGGGDLASRPAQTGPLMGVGGAMGGCASGGAGGAGAPPVLAAAAAAAAMRTGVQVFRRGPPAGVGAASAAPRPAGAAAVMAEGAAGRMGAAVGASAAPSAGSALAALARGKEFGGGALRGQQPSPEVGFGQSLPSKRSRDMAA